METTLVVEVVLVVTLATVDKVVTQMAMVATVLVAVVVVLDLVTPTTHLVVVVVSASMVQVLAVWDQENLEPTLTVVAEVLVVKMVLVELTHKVTVVSSEVAVVVPTATVLKMVMVVAVPLRLSGVHKPIQTLVLSS
jgi:hypothetical protein